MFAGWRVAVLDLTGGDTGAWTVTAGAMVETGRGGLNRDGDGDTLVELCLRGNWSVLSVGSASLPLAYRLFSPIRGTVFTGSPLRVFCGLGGTAPGVGARGFVLAICSK